MPVYRCAILVAEDLLLLLTDDRTGKLAAAADQLETALAGALLIELALARRIEVEDRGMFRAGRLTVRDGTPTSDPLLDEALARLEAEQVDTPARALRILTGFRDRLQARLIDRGILREESGRILGVFPVDRWPASDAAHEATVRARLAEALRAGATDEPRVVALLSLLFAVQYVVPVEKVVDPAEAGTTKKELRARARRIAVADEGSKAIRRAVAKATYKPLVPPA